MKILCLALLVAVVAFSGGCCVFSLEGFHTPETVVADEAFEGVWKQVPDAEGEEKDVATFMIEAEDGEYAITVIEPDDRFSRLRGVMFKLDDRIYLETSTVNENQNGAGFYDMMHQLPVFQCVRLNWKDAALHIETPNTGRWNELAGAEGLGVVSAEKIECLVTASAKDTEAFLKKHADDKELFDEFMALKKVR